MEMSKVVVVIFLSIGLFSLFCDAKKKQKIFKSFNQNENSTNEESNDEVRGSAFTEWTSWSRCNHRCKQMRSRRCLKVEVCQNKLQKNFRGCHSYGCKRKFVTVDGKNENDTRRPSTFRVMPHLDSYLYTQWSGWTSCSQSCLTKRIKRCHFLEICGEKPIVEQYKLCYKEGDDCERKYLERFQKLQKKEQHPVTVDTFDLEEEDDNPLSNMTCGLSVVSPSTRIIGGRTAIKGSWPWQVLLLNKKDQPFCGGVLLSTDWVLTAAHCVRRHMSVRAGEHDVRDHEDTEQQEKVSKTFVHPNYDLVTVESDLALLKMRTPFELNQFVQPICLPQPDYELPYYSRGTILGWGSRRADTVYTTDVLHQADVPIVPPKECQKAYKGHYIRGNMLCAGYETGNVDSCRGDSGGPLIHKQKDGTWAVYGVTSFGDGCGQKKKFGIYANVVTHLSWIIDIIKSQDEELPDSTGPLGK